MAKAKNGRTPYTSKGQRSPNKKISNAIRQETPLVNVELNALKAYNKGRKAYTTIANPDPFQTNKRFIRVELSSVLGDHRKREFIIK